MKRFKNNPEYILCLTGSRGINKRMTLFVEGILAGGFAARIVSLPRGVWRTEKSERPLSCHTKRVCSMEIGATDQARLRAIMCFHWLLLPLAVLVGMLRHIPVLYDEHDHYELNTLESGGSWFRQKCSGLMVRWIHRVCLRWVSVVTCIHMNESVLKRHLEQWQSSVVELHNYPVTAWRDSFRPRMMSGKLCFVYIGGVFAEKGPGLAAEAFLLLSAEEQSQAELHIFGEGCPQLIATLRKTAGVTVHNGVTPEQFRRFAVTHRCCGLSLLAATVRYQLVGTNCTKLYEYLALGMPVIATRVGEFPQFIDHNQIGLVIDGRMNAEELASAMRTLLKDEPLFCQMSHNASSLMKRDEMTWEREWSKVEQSEIFTGRRRAA